MTERNEEDKIAQAPIVVILGRKKYDVAPLVIRDSREWRKKVIELIAPLPQMTKVTTKNPETFGEVLKQMLVIMPDKVIELFFEYAKGLKQAEIEAEATDAEMAEAFKEVIAVAFPLAKSLPGVIERLAQ